MGSHPFVLSPSCHVSLSSLSSLSLSSLSLSPSSSPNFLNPKNLSFSQQPIFCSKKSFFSGEKKNLSNFCVPKKSIFRLKAEVETQERETATLGELSSEEKMSGVLEFAKYQGLGNDFLLVDNRNSPEPKVTPGQAIKLCDRNFGVGADGVIFALPGSEGSEYTMRIFNSDGSEPEMCGNGIRCMARFVAELEGAKNEPKTYRVQTLAGPMVLDLREDGQVAVDMGPPTLQSSLVPTSIPPTTENGTVVAAPLEIDGTVWKVTCVSMGNPHCITFSNENQENLKVSEIDLARIGPLFENNYVFPARTNTEFVEVVSPSELKMRVWERGAGATLACGTGACALVVAAVLEGRSERKCTVHLPGGPLEIEWREDDNHVYMTGPAEIVFHGKAYL